MEFNEQLKEARARLGLTQQEVADFIGMLKATYANYENKNMSMETENAQKIIASGFLNPDEMTWKLREVEKRKKNKRASSRHRIPNIPNFYKRLKKLENRNGNIRKGVNDKVLKELQIDLGVR